MGLCILICATLFLLQQTMQIKTNLQTLIGPLLLSSYIGQPVFHVPIDSQLRVTSTRQCPNFAQNIKSPDLEWILTIIGLSKIFFSRKSLFPGLFTVKTRQEVHACLMFCLVRDHPIYSRVNLLLLFYVCVILCATT